jgi:hypothetical protein
VYFLANVIWEEGNIHEDPLFLSYSEHFCALQEGSPCIDAGLNLSDLPPWDLLGNPRIWDGNGNDTAVVDMGAYEYGLLPVGTSEIRNQNSEFRIHCFPNPTDGVSSFGFRVSPARTTDIVQSGGGYEYISISIFDIHGREVASVLDAQMPAGEHTVRFDTSGLPAGLYVVKAQGGDEMDVVKMIKR